MAEAVYLLCALTSLACALLLGRAYLRTHTPILLWSTLCFILLAATNFLLLIDLAILGDKADLSLPRELTSLLALILLVTGLIWDAD